MTLAVSIATRSVLETLTGCLAASALVRAGPADQFAKAKS